MKVFSKSVVLILVVLGLVQSGFKPIPDDKKNESACSSNPTINSPTSASILVTTATLGGNVTSDGGGTCSVTDRGIYWNTASPATSGTQVSQGTGTGVFTVGVTGLPAGTKIYYVAYATNSNGTANTTEQSFYTQSTEPAAYGSLSATQISSTQVDLSFPKPSLASVSGYIILRRTSSDPTTSGVNDAAVATGATYFLTDINTDVGTYSDMTVTAGNDYHYTILPYNWDASHAATYNYLTSAGFPIATITPCAPGNVTGASAAPGGGSATISWTNDSCEDEVMVVAKQAAFTVAVPTGDGSAYTDALDFTSGASSTFDGGKVVYKGTSSGQTVIGLTNGLSYNFKIFTRKLSEWSNGVTVSATPCAPTDVTGTSATPSGNGAINVAWSNVSCEDAVMIVAKATAAFSGATPTGDGSSYVDNLDITNGSSSSFDGGKVVYKGTTSPQTITNLTGGLTYNFKIFTRKGTTWSTGTVVSAVACAATDVTGLGAVDDTSNQATINWTGPPCGNEVMVVVSNTSFTAAVPTGDGSAYTANLSFISGASSTFDGGKVVYKGLTSGQVVTNLANGTLYTVKVFTRNGTNWSSGTTASWRQGRPTVSTLSPVNGATNVITNTNLVITFSENVKVSSTPPAGNSDKVVLNGSIFINRSSITFSGNQATIPLGTTLSVSTVYDVVVGASVAADLNDNNFAGITTGNWGLTTNPGVTITAPSATACTGSYVSLGSIVITEFAVNNIAGTNSGSGTIVLKFDNPAFVFQSGVGSVSTSGGDITTVSISPINFSSSTITVNFDASALDELESITISGLKVSTDGSAPTGHIVKDASSTLNIEGIVNGTTTLATITSGTPPAAPTLGSFSSGTGTYCKNTNISAVTVSAVGSNITWYSNPLLTTVIGSGNSINLVSGAGINSTVVGSTTIYATQRVGCESTSLAVTVTIAPLPTANAGSNLTGLNAVCAGSIITLGGTPTLSNPSVPGTYTYAWTSPDDGTFVPPATSPTASNPTTTAPTGNPSLQTYHYSVLITDPNGCTASATKTVDVKADVTPVLTSPPTTSFTSTNVPVVLSANPSGGTFTGTGVINTGASPNPYSFDPKLAYNTSGPPTQTFPIDYTFTTNGCTKTVVAFVTFSVNNTTAPFGAFPTQFCANEFPIAAFTAFNSSTYAPLHLTQATEAQILAYVASYNCCGTTTPIKYVGMTRNYYEGYYGGTTVGGPNTVRTVRPTGNSYTPVGSSNSYPEYGFSTDGLYNSCTFCNYAYVAAYVEFQNPLSVLTAFSYYGIVAGVPFDNGYVFYDPVGNRSGFYYTGQFVNLNQIPAVSMSLADGTTLCKESLAGSTFLTTVSGTFSAGFFEMSFNGNTFVKDAASGNAINNPGVPNGTAQLNSQNAWTKVSTYVIANNTWNGGTFYNVNANVVQAGTVYRCIVANSGNSPSSSPGFWEANTLAMPLRYAYDPGTKGSDDVTPCYAYSTITVYLHDRPTVAFSPVPADNTVFCNSDPVVTLTTNRGSGMSYSGPGVADPNNGVSAFFTPSNANITTGQQDVTLTAVYTDIYGCRTQTTKPLRVNPKITANMNFPRNVYCNEDTPVNLVGNTEVFGTLPTGTATANPSFKVDYLDASNLPATINYSASNSYSFNPKALYALTSGGTTQNFTITYTETLNAGKICTNSITPVVLVVKAPIVLDFTMVNSNPIFCANNPTAINTSSTNLVNNILNFTGNVPGSGVFTLDVDNDFSSVNASVASTATTSAGTVTIDAQNAYNNSPATGIKPFFLQYAYTGAGCTAPATVVKPLQISDKPPIAFAVSPAAKYCNYDPAITLTATSSPAPPGPFTFQLFGFGVVDNNNGTASYTPKSAYDASIAAGGTVGTNQTNPVKAIVTDANGCRNFVSASVQVNTIPLASFTVNGSPVATTGENFCYTAPTPAAIAGNTSQSWYDIVYKGVVTPRTDHIGSFGSTQSTFSFLPKTYFDNSVAIGANILTPTQYDVIYSVKDADGCINTLPAVQFNVTPQQNPTISNIVDGEVFCTNVGSKTINLAPFPASTGQRTLNVTVNGVLNNITSYSSTYDLNAHFTKGNGANIDILYIVQSGSGCTDQVQISVKAVPSPTATILSPSHPLGNPTLLDPACINIVTSYTADTSPNNPTVNVPPGPTAYTWTFANGGVQSLTGSSVTFANTTTGVNNVTLNVAYPTNLGATCQETFVANQVTGGFPDPDFTVSNVCEGDQTNLVGSNNPLNNSPIANYAWDFGDGAVTGFGGNTPIVSPPANTSGNYNTPIHKFAYSVVPYNVKLTAQTAASAGACVTSITKKVSILKFLTPLPTPSAFYRMSLNNGGDGYFVVEDAKTPATNTWTFSNASPAGAPSLTRKAWHNPNYLPGEQSYLNSPCFDLRNFARPLFDIQYTQDLKAQIDGVAVQYSIDGGATWATLGGVATGLDWYDLASISSHPGGITANPLSSGFSKRGDSEWHDGRHSLNGTNALPGSKGSALRSKVRFRVAFASDQSATAAGLNGFAFSEVRIEERNRVTLAENFTNNNLPISTPNNADFAAFDGTNYLELVKLQYHVGLPSGDAINKQNQADPNARAGFYGLTNNTVPRGYLDGIISNGNFVNANTSWVNTSFGLRSLVPSPIDFYDVSGNLQMSILPPAPGDNNKIAVTATFTAIQPITSGNLAFFMAVVEKNVGTNGYVVRKLLPEASGSPIKLPITVGQSVTLAPAPWEVKGFNNVNQLGVVAFIQDLDTREVIQAAFLDTPTNLPTVITGLGEETALESKLIKVYPVPANNELNVVLPAPAKTDVSLELTDQMGKTVHQSSIKEGVKEKIIHTTDLAAGVYILQVDSGDGNLFRKKVMVVHQH